MNSRYLDTQRGDNDQSIKPRGNEQGAAPVEEPPRGGGPFECSGSIPLDRTPSTEQVEIPQGSLESFRGIDDPQLHRRSIQFVPLIGTESHRYHTTEDFERPRSLLLPVPRAQGLHRSTDGQLREVPRESPVEESQPITDPQLRVRSSRFRVKRVKEPSRWTSEKSSFGARVPECFRNYQCFFIMLSVLIFILAGLFSWFYLYVSTRYIGWYFKLKVFYHTLLSPNKSVEQITAVEGDMDLINV